MPSLPTSRSLPRGPFQVVVVGGGINGVAIARECALAGKQTLLLEKHDFASGATSRSTRIIHGGLRYLEHGEIALVRESLRERQRLLAERPHLVRPLTFLLALGSHTPRSPLEVRFGLWLYRRMAGAHARFDARAESLARQLDSDGDHAWRVFQYDDAQCEFPERLVAEWLVEALDAGAEPCNHTEVLQVTLQANRVRGVRVRDLLTGQESEIEAACVINACGPWADQLAQRSSVHTAAPMIGGVRGSHIVLPQFTGCPETAVYAEAVDGRPFFVIPWNSQLLVGTTEVAHTGDPSSAEPSPSEIEYLFTSFQHLFPAAPLQWADIRHAFAGVRPLPYSPGSAEAAITRRSILHDHAEDRVSGLLSVIGGKLTTAASMARQAARHIGIQVEEPAAAVIAPADDLEDCLARCAGEIVAIAGVSPESARALVQWQGRRSLAVARLAKHDPRLRRPLCPHTPHIVAEAVAAFHEERATTLADALLRRVPVALGACWSDECTHDAAAAIGAALGWSDYQVEAEIEAFSEERSRFLRPAPRAVS